MKDIEKVLNDEVRPLFNSHRGDIHIISLMDGILRIKMSGECSGCPSSSFEVEEIVKKTLMHRFPQITDVVLINEISDDLIEFAHKILKTRN